MYIVKVHSEWNLGIPELFTEKSLAQIYVRSALSYLDIEESLEDLEKEGLISYEIVRVVEYED